MSTLATLDLGVMESREALVAELQARRAEHLQALAAPRLPIAPGLDEALRSTRLAEIALCEDALSGFGAPFVVETETRDA